MTRQAPERPVAASSLLANAIVAIVVALAIAAAIVLGVFAFVALGGILLVLAAVFGIRMWWLDRRRARRGLTARPESRAGPGRNDVIEGEYRVIGENSNGDRPA